MEQPHPSPTAPEPPTNIIPLPPAAPPRNGRPTLLTPELEEQICTAIRVDGMSDTGAGLLLGVSKSTLSRWKTDDEDFAVSLGQARAQFEQQRLQEIRSAHKRDGSPEWRAVKWLLQTSSPETYGEPARRRQPKPQEAEPERDPDHPVITPRDLELLQEARARHCVKLKAEHDATQAEAAARKNSPIRPETPSPLQSSSGFQPLSERLHEPAPAPQRPVPPRKIIGWGSPGFVYPPPQNCTIRPETPLPPTAPSIPSTPSISPAAAAEEFIERVQSLLRAPDLHPRSYYEDLDDLDRRDIIPGMWTGSV